MKIFERLCGCIFLSLFLLTAAQFAVAQDESKSYKGLWVGEVILNKVSMLDGTKPEEPTADTVSMRVILHVNAENDTYLLSHVVLAQSAGAEEEMLFTDEEDKKDENGKEKLSKLSEWIKAQKDAGKKFAVRRIETVSYDLPRKNLPSGSCEDFDQKELKEDYELSHQLEGEVAPGKTVNGSLVMDKWHRSNPFRHAYHNQHTDGYCIVREIQFAFDEEPSDEGKSRANYGVEVLTGSYQETVRCGTKDEAKKQKEIEITITGTFTLYKISSVGKLNQ